MKVKPVMDALEERGVKVILVRPSIPTPAMSDVLFADLGIRPPDLRAGAARPPAAPALWDGRAGTRIAAAMCT